MSDMKRDEYPLKGISDEEVDEILKPLNQESDEINHDPIFSGSPTDLGGKILSPEAQRLVDEASGSANSSHSEPDAEIRKFVEAMFPKELPEKWQLFLTDLSDKPELSQARDLLGQPRNWEEFRNAMELLYKNHPDIGGRVRTEFAKFHKK